MRTVTIGKHKVKFYDSPKEELSIRRYAKYNKHIIVSSEVGCSIEDYNKRHKRAIQYVSAEDYKSAKKELINQQQCVFNALSEYNPNLMALAIMVHSIDDKVYSGYEESLLNEIIDKLDSIGFTIDMVDNTLSEVKKKSSKKSKPINHLILALILLIMSLGLIKALLHLTSY
jgi:hypothetical protein